MTDKNIKPNFNPLSLSIWLAILFSGIALVTYAYLGTFSRHLADDYCSVTFTRSNFLGALQNRYLNVSNRFTNVMLIGLSEFLWPRGYLMLPALMLVLWVVGLTWLLREVSRLAAWNWTKSTALVLSLLLPFFALLQAPNLYQTLYWRSSMATHFAPLVFIPYLASFLLRSIFLASKTRPSRFFYPFCFFLAFLLGGFSEPTVVIVIVLLGYAILAVWFWNKAPTRSVILNMLAWPLAGAVAALLVMAFAPANSLRLGDAPPELPDLVLRSFRYAFEFILDSFKSLPLPTLLTVFMPLMIFYGLYAFPFHRLTRTSGRRVMIILAVAPVLSYLLIVASFAPSVYGQSFPVERARFAGQLCLVAALMVEGAVLGVLLAQWRPRGIEVFHFDLISTIILGITALYPLRAAWLTLGSVPEYRERARLWDARDSYVQRHAALGEANIIVPGYSGIYGIKEWDEDPNHWINLCAAQYYRVDSIIAAPISDDHLWEYLSE